MKIICGLLFAFSATASACPPELSKGRALQAALVVEGLSGGTPLTYDVELTAKRLSGWRVVLGYSGVQRSYLVSVDPESCRLTEISLEH